MDEAGVAFADMLEQLRAARSELRVSQDTLHRDTNHCNTRPLVTFITN